MVYSCVEPDGMRFVIITGPSGAGKTLALNSFEDAGYYAVDNLPPRLLPALADYCQGEGLDRCAAVSDTRSGGAFDELSSVIGKLGRTGYDVELLYLDASDEALVRRFKETRRPHPLLPPPEQGFAAASIVDAIAAERALLQRARAIADRVLDTSALTPGQLRDAIQNGYNSGARTGLVVTVTSFGFKHGIPMDADLVFDVRFLRNPHYVPPLRGLTGRDAAVAAYVHADPLASPFELKIYDLIRFALPAYLQEGKAYLNVALGCTGGQHRSVVLAEDLATRLRADGCRIAVQHRDISDTEPGVEDLEVVAQRRPTSAIRSGPAAGTSAHADAQPGALAASHDRETCS